MRSPLPTLALTFLVGWIAATSLADDRGRVAHGQQAPGAGAATSQLRIGVVDMKLAFEKSKRREDLEAEINEYRKKQNDGLNELREKIDKLTEELAIHKEGTETFELLSDERESLVSKLDGRKKYLPERLKRRINDSTLRVLDEISESAKIYGEDNGYHLILRKDLGLDRDVPPLPLVIYSARTFDITAAVIEVVNHAYEIEKAGKKK